ncbi:MAG: hypothetical protein KUG56_04460, partial [Kordiimonadaceae bacterium]|nr:hypothetical protein [Kordiimonadaceae bacterium]
MSKIKFVSFYTTMPFWAGDAIDLTAPNLRESFREQMCETVIEVCNEQFTLRFARDGNIELRIGRLEQEIESSDTPKIQDMIRFCAMYLKYVNTLQFLLEASSLETDRTSIFSLEELTNKDIARTAYKDGQPLGGQLPTQGFSPQYFFGQNFDSYSTQFPVQLDSKLMSRSEVSKEAIKRCSEHFTTVLATDGLENYLSSLAKSIAEYKIGNYEISIILAWFIAEKILFQKWATLIAISYTHLTLPT